MEERAVSTNTRRLAAVGTTVLFQSEVLPTEAYQLLRKQKKCGFWGKWVLPSRRNMNQMPLPLIIPMPFYMYKKIFES